MLRKIRYFRDVTDSESAREARPVLAGASVDCGDNHRLMEMVHPEALK
jgi:hypothetical protein